jgi:hypothetical protein
VKVIVLCSPEHLPAYTNDKLKNEELAFGFNISVATDEDRPANDDLLKPWKWPQISKVMIYIEPKEGGKPVYAEIPIKPLTSWLGKDMDKPLQSGQPTKRQRICAQFTSKLDSDFDECAQQAERTADKKSPDYPFAWRDAGPSQFNQNVRHWHTIVGQTATLPAPFPQSLNLSFFLRVKRDDVLKPGAKVFIAPIIPDDSVARVCPPTTPQPLFPCELRPKVHEELKGEELGQLENNNPMRKWSYRVPNGCDLPHFVAYAALCEVEEPPARAASGTKKDASSTSLLDLQSLWVGKLMGDEADTFDTDWRAGLEDRMAETFDLTTPIIECLRKYINENQTQADSNLVREGVNLALAALRDLAGIGLGPDLGRQSLIERLRGRRFQNPDEKQQIEAAVKAKLGSLAEWRRILRELPGAANLKLLADQPTALVPAEAVNELEQVKLIALDAQVLPALVKAQWKEIFAPDNSKKLASQLDHDIKTKALNLRRQLALENLAHVWPYLIKAEQLGVKAEPRVRAEPRVKAEQTSNSGQSLIKDYLPGFLSAYFCKRFELPLMSKLASLGFDSKVINAKALQLYDTEYLQQQQYPTVDSVSEGLQNKLLLAVKTWGDNFAADILPGHAPPKGATPGDVLHIAAQPPQRGEPPLQSGMAPTDVPHALTLQVDKLDAPVGNENDLRLDLLTRISGVGLLMREVEVGREWRCLNMATAKSTGDVDSEQTLVLAPVRLNYQNELRQAFITYNNHPLSSQSPVAAMRPGLIKHTTDDRHALVEYDYPRSATHPELTKLTPLKFGSYYEVLPFIISNCGALPVELARDDNTPWEIDLDKFNREWKDPKKWAAVRAKVRPGSDSKKAGTGNDPKKRGTGSDPKKTGIGYLRKVRVGQIRVFNYQHAQAQEQKDSRVSPRLDLNIPVIPANVYPRARDMEKVIPGETGQVSSDRKQDEHPLLLLSDAGWERSGGRNQFEFYLRLPATDLNTWDRWVAKDAGSAQLRKDVWADFYRRSDDKRGAASDCFTKDVSIDDPALATYFYVELYHCDGAQPPSLLRSEWIGVPDALWPDPNPSTLDAVQRGKVKVICQYTGADDAGLQSDEQKHELTVKVAKGEVYCLIVYACLPSADEWRFAEPGILPSPKKIIKRPQTKQDYLAVAPFHFIIEAATDELIKGIPAGNPADPNDENAAAAAILWSSLAHFFSQGAITARLNALTDPQGVITAPSKAVADDRFCYLRRAELLRQVWRWQGRETAPHPSIFSKETTFWTPHQKPDGAPLTEGEKLRLWEAYEFGARPDTDYLAVNMEPGPPNPRGSLYFSYREVLEFARPVDTDSQGANPQRQPKAGADDELRALHYRFSVRAHSRYAGIMPDPLRSALIAKGEPAKDLKSVWKPCFVPCRRREPIPPPKVKFVLPLTETAEDATNRTPGVIVVCHGAWHEVGGLAEWMRAEIELVDYKNESYYELGPDPLLAGPDPLLAAPATGHPRSRLKICLAAQEIRGPIGHTFDRAGDAPLFTSTSFIIPAPALGAQELAWYFCKMKFQRVVTFSSGQRFGAGCDNDPEAVELVSEPTCPFWVQFLPPFSVLSDLKTRDLRLQVGKADGQQRLSFVRRDNNQPVTLPTSNQSKFVTFENYLVVTRKVFDAIGAPDQETFVGVFYPAEAGRWAPMERAQPPSFKESDPLRARVIEVQRHTQSGSQSFKNEDQFWKVLFAEGEADPQPGNQNNPRARINDSERARITRISEPVNSMAAEPPACE